MAKSPIKTIRRRKSERPGAGPRERILAAADELFYSRGICHVGVDEIIATAGVAKASLYSHFASKDELIAEYVQKRGAAWWDWFRGAVEASAASPSDRLIAVFDVLATWFSEPSFRGCALQNACVELANSRHTAHRTAVTNKRAVQGYLADLAEQAGAHAPKAVAAQLALLMEGAIVTALFDGSSSPARTARATAAVLIRDM